MFWDGTRWAEALATATLLLGIATGDVATQLIGLALALAALRRDFDVAIGPLRVSVRRRH
jgi:hypothetical protein